MTGLPVGCSAADFSFGDVTLNESVSASTTGPPHMGTLTMANTASNQDACKNASPILGLKTAL